MEFQEMKDQLVAWMNEMSYGYRDPDVYAHELVTPNGEKQFVIKLFTHNNQYSIVCRCPHDDYKGYIGCQGSSRKPRAGETWTRGNDLHDGEFSRETWVSILADIVGYELEKIHRPVKLMRY